MGFKPTSVPALVLILFCGALLGCNRDVPDEPKVKPKAVPTTAIWAGGPDGGAYIDCAPSQDGEPNACTVYNDSNGNVEMSGGFVLPNKHGSSAAQLKYSGSPDGNSIYLQSNLVLSPASTVRPASVPKSALLAENGIYVDCQPGGTDLYQCSLFLAADARRIASATYRCDSSLSLCAGHLQPKIANRDAIYLQNAGALESTDGRP